MPSEIITSDDLREFKIELLDEIKKLLKTTSNLGPGKYLKSPEMMKLLNVSMGTLLALRINGTLPYTKIGNIIFFDAEEVHKMMKENSIHHKY